MYVRAPERIFGAEMSTQAVDAWALGVIALCLSTGACPWIDFNYGEELAVVASLVKLVGPITASSWPGHEDLPKWREISTQVDLLPAPCFFLARAAALHPQNQPLVCGVEVSEMCMRWCPQERSSMQEVLQRLQSSRPARERRDGPSSAPRLVICKVMGS